MVSGGFIKITWPQVNGSTSARNASGHFVVKRDVEEDTFVARTWSASYENINDKKG